VYIAIFRFLQVLTHLYAIKQGEKGIILIHSTPCWVDDNECKKYLAQLCGNKFIEGYK
jgi:hypothetical protein